MPTVELKYLEAIQKRRKELGDANAQLLEGLQALQERNAALRKEKADKIEQKNIALEGERRKITLDAQEDPTVMIERLAAFELWRAQLDLQLNLQLAPLDEQINLNEQEIALGAHLYKERENLLASDLAEKDTRNPVTGRRIQALDVKDKGAYSRDYIDWVAKMVAESQWSTLENHLQDKKKRLIEEGEKLQKAESEISTKLKKHEAGRQDNESVTGILHTLEHIRSSDEGFAWSNFILPLSYYDTIGFDTWQEKVATYKQSRSRLQTAEEWLEAFWSAPSGFVGTTDTIKKKEEMQATIADCKKAMRIVAGEMRALLHPILLERELENSKLKVMLADVQSEKEAVQISGAAIEEDLRILGQRRMHVESRENLVNGLFVTTMVVAGIAVLAGFIGGWGLVVGAIATGSFLLAGLITWVTSSVKESEPAPAPEFKVGALSNPMQFKDDLAKAFELEPKGEVKAVVDQAMPTDKAMTADWSELAPKHVDLADAQAQVDAAVAWKNGLSTSDSASREAYAAWMSVANDVERSRDPTPPAPPSR